MYLCSMKRRAVGYTWLEITKAYYNIIFKNKNYE